MTGTLGDGADPDRVRRPPLDRVEGRSRRRARAATSRSSTSRAARRQHRLGRRQRPHGDERPAVNSVSGDAVVGEVFGDLTAGTVSGDLIVRAAGPGEVGLKAVSGDVVVAMRRGLRVRSTSTRSAARSARSSTSATRPRAATGRRRTSAFAPSAATSGSRARRKRSRSGVRGLWRHRDFLSLWGAETISQFGSQVSLLALPLVAILVLEESAFKVAALTSVEFLPFLLFTLPAGVWVDRLRRKPILVLGNVGRAVALMSVPIGTGRGLTIWQLYAVGFAVGVCTVFDVAYQSYIPALVGARTSSRRTRSSRSAAAANIAGPGMAGGLVALLTAPVAVLVDASATSPPPSCSSASASRRRRHRGRSDGRSGPSSVRASATSSGTRTSARWW